MDEQQLENLIMEIVRLREKGRPDAEIIRAFPAREKEVGEILALIRGTKESGENIVVPESLTRKIISGLPAEIPAVVPRAKPGAWSVFANWKIAVPASVLAVLLAVFTALKLGGETPEQYARGPETPQQPPGEQTAAPAETEKATAPSALKQLEIATTVPKTETPGGIKPQPTTAATVQPAAPDIDSIVSDFLAASLAEEALAADEEAAAGSAGSPAGDTDSFIGDSEL